MSNYQFAESQTGPWMAFQFYETGKAAFEAAKAKFNWKSIYVARMRQMRFDDVYSADVLMADIEESIADKFGASALQQFQDERVAIQALVENDLAERFDTLMIPVPDRVRRYHRDGTPPKESDFEQDMPITEEAQDEPARLKLEDLM